uniref:Uncharacterized protein n=1 Tax=Aegilops tauschii subsp. strangulata TaxID=200361 RepID=A0A453SNF7_AEGTS
ALVRRDDAEVIDMLPRSVDIAVGDVGDPLAVQSAVSGCSKIIYCATARSTITGDLNRVDNQGVRNVSKAFQDYYNEMAQLRAGKSSKSKLLIAKFKSAKSLKGWEVNQGSYFPNAYASGSSFDEGIDASFEFSEGGQAVFAGICFYKRWICRDIKEAISPFRFHPRQVRWLASFSGRKWKIICCYS